MGVAPVVRRRAGYVMWWRLGMWRQVGQRNSAARTVLQPNLREEQPELVRMQPIAHAVTVSVHHQHERRSYIRYAIPINVSVST